MIDQKNIKHAQLILDDNKIDDSFFQMVASLTSYSGYSLFFKQNRYTDVADSEYYEEENGHIYRLSVANNLITDAGIVAFQSANSLLMIQEINFSRNNGITDKSIQRLCTLACTYSISFDVSQTGLSLKDKVQDLFVVYNALRINITKVHIDLSNR